MQLHGQSTFQQAPRYSNTIPFVGNTYRVNAPLTQTKILAHQVENLQKQMTNMQTVNDKKSYTMEDLHPYPFDRTLYMPPFPPHFETPRFDKYRGKGDVRDYVQELFTTCIEVVHEDTYLMHLFPKSLGGTALKWFSHRPPKISSLVSWLSYSSQTFHTT